MTAKPIVFGYSWVGILNQLFLQWLFVRLQAEVVSEKDRTITGFKLIGFIVPLTGWWSDYVWAWKLMKT